jgi:dTDP-4-dehydrorhamnose reductase
VLGQTGQPARSLVEIGNACGLKILAVDWPELEITNRGSIDNAIRRFKPDIVSNTAAYIAVDQAEREPELAFVVNRTLRSMPRKRLMTQESR